MWKSTQNNTSYNSRRIISCHSFFTEWTPIRLLWLIAFLNVSVSSLDDAVGNHSRMFSSFQINISCGEPFLLGASLFFLLELFLLKNFMTFCEMLVLGRLLELLALASNACLTHCTSTESLISTWWIFKWLLFCNCF